MSVSALAFTLLFLYSLRLRLLCSCVSLFRYSYFTLSSLFCALARREEADAWRLVCYTPRDTPVGTPKDTPLGTPKVRGVDAWRLVGYTPRHA